MEKEAMLLLLAILLVSCAVVPETQNLNQQTNSDGDEYQDQKFQKNDSNEKTITQEKSSAIETKLSKANADVLFVKAHNDGNSWAFSVTVVHPDKGWDDYADGWDVVLPDGTVVIPAGQSKFTRLLTHPHDFNVPFSRDQSGIPIPEGITQVTVRAHDLIDGYGGNEIVVDLAQKSGERFEVS